MGHKSQIMYIEPKSNGVASLSARIGRVAMSKTGRTLTYKDQSFQKFKGYKANHFDVETTEEYWISGCRKDGNDGLYMTTVHVDEDIRVEYWTHIRGMPERKDQASFKSRGKHRIGRHDLKNKVGNI